MPSSTATRPPLTFIVLLLLTMGCSSATRTTVPEPPLVGSVWLVEDIDERGVIDFLQSTVEFESDAQIAGMAGCNRYFGSMERDGEEITIGPLASTRKFCTEAVMEQEQRLLHALERVTRYEFKETMLFMYAGDTTVLRLTRLENK